MTARKLTTFELSEEIDLVTACEMIIAAGCFGAASSDMPIKSQILLRSTLRKMLARPLEEVPETAKFLLDVAIRTAEEPTFAAGLIDALVKSRNA